jgi:hypothetical protein
LARLFAAGMDEKQQPARVRRQLLLLAQSNTRRSGHDSTRASTACSDWTLTKLSRLPSVVPEHGHVIKRPTHDRVARCAPWHQLMITWLHVGAFHVCDHEAAVTRTRV